MKKRLFIYSLLTVFFLHSAVYLVRPYSVPHNDKSSHEYRSFHDWAHACNKLYGFDARYENPFQTPLSQECFSKELDTFFSVVTTQLAKIPWVQGKPSPYFYGLSHDHFEPYVQKLFVPIGSTIAVHGDFHGDVHALNSFLSTLIKGGYLDQHFKIKRPDFYMFFLGDYTDRGWYGAEVIYTVLRLKTANPDKVFMVRGNHEDGELNDRYGFSEELERKFGSSELIKKVYRLYNFLPLAIYLGSGRPGDYNVIQCCHGGIEMGFDPRELLSSNHSIACTKIEHLMQADGFAHISHLGLDSLRHFFKNYKKITTENGFMWNDFIVDSSKIISRSPRDGYSGIFFEFGKLPTQDLLYAWSTNACTIQSIFRAHQHDFKETDMRKRILNQDGLSHAQDAGVGKLWIHNKPLHKKEPGRLRDVSVVTFSVAPGAGYDWPYDAFGLLQTSEKFDDWRLHVYRIAIGKKGITTNDDALNFNEA